MFKVRNSEFLSQLGYELLLTLQGMRLYLRKRLIGTGIEH